MLLHQRGDNGRDPGKPPEFGLGKDPFLAHQRQNDMGIALHMRKVANFFGHLGAHIVGAEVFTLIETVRRQIAQPVEARQYRTDRAKIKWIQKIGPLDIVADKDLAPILGEIVIYFNGPAVALVSENHGEGIGHH